MSKEIRNYIDKIKNLNEVRENFNTVYHGTDINSANNIKNNGVDISYSSGGYFGWGFYTTPDYNLAKSNYADFSDDDNGVVLEFDINPKANILDLSDSEDFETWKIYAKRQGDKNLYKLLVNNGIDGLYDNSFEGVVIYNPKVLIFKGIIQ